MTYQEYNSLMNAVSKDTVEREIYLEIERYLRNGNCEVYQISASDYTKMRDRILLHRNNSSDSKEKENNEKSACIFWGIVVAVLYIVSYFTRDGISMVCGIVGTLIAIPTIACIGDCFFGGTDYEKLDEYNKINRNARLNTEAYIRQANIHSNSIKMVNDKINRR